MNQYCLFLAFVLIICAIEAQETVPFVDHTLLPVQTQQPLEEKVYPIAIIGSGAAGTMAANRGVLNNSEVLLFAGARQERRRSRGNWVRQVDNIPGMHRYERTVLQLRNETLQELAASLLGHNLYIIDDSVVSLQKREDHFELTDGAGKSYRARYVVLATA